MSDNDCSSQTPKQMEKDLESYSSGVSFAAGLEEAEKRFDNAGAYAWCHYVIKVSESFSFRVLNQIVIVHITLGLNILNVACLWKL